MTTWILIVSFATGFSSGFEYAIPNLVSYAECARVATQIPENKYGSGGGKTFKCIEVYTK